MYMQLASHNVCTLSTNFEICLNVNRKNVCEFENYVINVVGLRWGVGADWCGKLTQER